MPTNKAETIEQLTTEIKKSMGLYLADFTKVKVQTVTALRRDLRRKGIRIRVAKNTLIQRALNDCGISGLDSHLAGPTALIMSDDQDPIAPAKLLVDFHKANEGLMTLKAIHIDGQAYPGNQLASIAKMPGKRELQSQVISLAMGPAANLLSLVKGPASRLASQIQALATKLEEKEVVTAA
jgi:large subunit ribosomal protein L10